MIICFSFSNIVKSENLKFDGEKKYDINRKNQRSVHQGIKKKRTADRMPPP